MKEERKESVERQVFTKDQLERMAKELIVKTFGTIAPSLSQRDRFINTIIENKYEAKALIKLAQQMIKEESLLMKFDEKTINN